uniref:Integrase catalytic domain-containing protein n=1 Tax=Physcomitrium patens TaxID=3218 RepID=A0A2K1JRZ5_PHYPA|nr:hypothetical protein PHYPA_016684 [Physcomitrium patens]
MWDSVERKLTPASFPITVGASTYTVEQFKIHKLKAQALLVMAVKDEFLKTVYEEIIQSLIVQDKLPTFALISSKLLNKSHRLALRRNRLGEEQAFITQLQRYQPRHQIFDREKQHTQGRRDHSTHSRIHQPSGFQHITRNQGFQRRTRISYRKKLSLVRIRVTRSPSPNLPKHIHDASWVFFIHEKSETLRVFHLLKQLTENETGLKLSGLRIDHGVEFKSSAFQNYFQNGIAERRNRMIFQRRKAVNIANLLINRSPTIANRGVTLYESFDCLAYVHVPKTDRSKLESRTKKYIVCEESKIGYEHATKTAETNTSEHATQLHMKINDQTAFSNQQAKNIHHQTAAPSHEDELPLTEISHYEDNFDSGTIDAPKTDNSRFYNLYQRPSSKTRITGKDEIEEQRYPI